MEFKDLTLEQLQDALKMGSPEEMKAFLQNEGIELTFHKPQGLPEETEKFGIKLWRTVMFPPRVICGADEHDYQPTGNVEMERTAATTPGSSFRREFACTKCGIIKWESDMKVEVAADAGAAAAGDDDRAARRAARKAAREAKQAAE